MIKFEQLEGGTGRGTALVLNSDDIGRLPSITSPYLSSGINTDR